MQVSNVLCTQLRYCLVYISRENYETLIDKSIFVHCVIKNDEREAWKNGSKYLSIPIPYLMSFGVIVIVILMV